LADYRAVLTIDYSTPIDSNDYNRLLNAICQAGWAYAETSALYVECDDLGPILLALEVLARAVDDPGTLSALNIQVQLIGDDRDPPAASNHALALDNMLKRPLPSDGNV
jgi:hypothetical protein